MGLGRYKQEHKILVSVSWYLISAFAELSVFVVKRGMKLLTKTTTTHQLSINLLTQIIIRTDLQELVHCIRLYMKGERFWGWWDA